MIRLRFVALLGVFGLLLAGYFAYGLRGRPAPAFVGATDPAHAAATEAMLKGLPGPAGMTLDPYGTGCDTAGSYCFTSSSVEPETVFTAMTRTLVAQGGRVRSHACGGKNLIKHGCVAVVDYHSSGITVTAAPNLRPDNALVFLRLSVSGVDNSQLRKASAPYGSWASVDPLPASWTTGMTCTTQTAAGCSRFMQKSTDAPAVSATLAQACSTVRGVMEGHYYLINEVSSPATQTTAASCGFFGHRYRTVGGKDPEVLSVSVRATDASHVVAHVTLSTWDY